MMSPVTLGLIRHLLTFVGGVLVSYGVINADAAVTMMQSVETILGILVSMAGVGMSVMDKRNGKY